MIERIQRIPIVVLLIPLIVGILWCNYSHDSVLLKSTEFSYMDSVHIFKVVVSDYPSPSKKTDQYEIRILGVADSSTLIPAHGRAYLYVMRDSARIMPLAGDTLWIRTSFHRGGIMGDFDYGRYLRRQGILGTAFVASSQWKLAGHGQLSRWNPLVWQKVLLNRYRQLGFNGEQLGILSALSLGYKDELNENIYRSFRQSGAAHILAVSGLHTGIIYAVIIFLLNGFGFYPPLYDNKRRKIINGCICIALLWLYALLTRMTPSVVRSVIMFSLVELARMTYRQPISFNTIFAAAFIILCFRPNDIFSISFQLSFAAVIAIVFCAEYIPHISVSKRIIHSKWRKVILYFLGIVVVSLAAQVGTIPLTLYYFGQTSNYFLLTNLLVLPLAWAIVVGALLILTIGWIPGVGWLLSFPLKWMLDILYGYVSWIESLPGSVTFIHTSLPMVLCLYTAIISGIFTLSKSNWWLIPTALSLSTFCYLYTL